MRVSAFRKRLLTGTWKGANMKKKIKYPAVLTGLFCTFLGCGAFASVFMPKKSFSETENRYLAQRPSLTWQGLKSGAFGREYETYLSDQFPFRDQWIGVKTTAEQLQQKKEINGVWLGKDHYLIETFYQEDLDPELSGKNLDRLCQFVSAQEALAGKDHVRVMLVPSSAEIMTDKLPPFASPFSQAAVTERLTQGGIGEMLVPVRQALSDAREHQAPYYRTDHHWTSFGAFAGYQAWAKSLGLDSFELSDFQPETVSDNFFGTIHSKLNIPVQPDSIVLYRPKKEPDWSVCYDGSDSPVSTLYSMDALNTRDQYRVFLDGNHGWTKIKNHSRTDGSRLLIIKDSYAHCFAPFAALHFEETHMIDLRYYNGKISNFIEEQGITDILVLYQIPGFLKDRNVSKLTW